MTRRNPMPGDTTTSAGSRPSTAYKTPSAAQAARQSSLSTSVPLRTLFNPRYTGYALTTKNLALATISKVLPPSERCQPQKNLVSSISAPKCYRGIRNCLGARRLFGSETWRTYSNTQKPIRGASQTLRTSRLHTLRF
uniref:Uncharacterized protein n=1 Tax=Erythrolobus australicus TaxID=1077150 RepID=A0A7S1TLF0_9RHOD